MKILLVNNDKGWGGGQEHLQALAGELARSGCAPHFLCRRGSPSARNFAAAGYTVHALPSKGVAAVTSVAATALLLRRERFDIVQVAREHDLFRTAIAWKLAFPAAGAGRFVMCYHTATSRRQLFLDTADAVVCISTHVKERLLAGNPDAAPRVGIIYNGISAGTGIPADKADPWRERRFFEGAGFPLIGMVGAFFKNQAELVDALPPMLRRFPGMRLALVGDDSDTALLAPLRGRIRDMGLADHVIFTGRVPHERLADIYFDLDLSVSTFRNEGFGLVHLESLAAGTPVVAYNAGGQVDILAGEDAGLLVDGGVPEFAAAVVGLLQDHERRVAMGRNGCELVQRKYSLEAMADGYRELYRKLRQE